MDDMDIDIVEHVPDTPDRLSVKQIRGGKCSGKETNSSLAVHGGSSHVPRERYFDRPWGRDKLVTENGLSKKLHLHHRRTSDNPGAAEAQKETFVSSPLNESYASRNASVFRRLKMEKGAKFETKYNIDGQHLDKGKAICSKFPSKSFQSHQEDNAAQDLNEKNGHNQIFERDVLRGGLKDLLAGERKEGQVQRNSGSYLHTAPKSSDLSRNTLKGKEKVDDSNLTGVKSVMDYGKGVGFFGDSAHKIEKQMPAPHESVVPPRIGRKRLVRNGCISPMNIAIKSKQLAKQSVNRFKDDEQNHSTDTVSDGQCMIDISEIVAEDSNHGKGKEAAIHPHTSKENDTNMIDLSSSSAANNNANRTCQSSRDICFEEKGLWRTTHNHSENVDSTAERHFRSFNGSGCQVNQQKEIDSMRGESSRVACDSVEIQDAQQRNSMRGSNFNQISEPSPAIKMLSKRQRKHGLRSKNRSDNSRVIRDDSDIVFLDSPGESSSRSLRIQDHQFPGFVVLDESSEMSQANAHFSGCGSNDESEARARQVEEDEMFARALQEQLNHEIDENIARALQQEEEGLTTVVHPNNHFTFRNSNITFARSSTRHSNRQRQLPSSRVPASSIMSQRRSRASNHARAASSRTRSLPFHSSGALNFQFPMHMDLDMRLDILEAMEAAVQDNSNIRRPNSILQMGDFDENDYEILLALDENNHQHSGASASQINNLPQSTVQTENFGEDCAICLETPTIGETVRHLPCLHKFHKDCIDTWLSRKTSCPICKSSIT